MKDIKSCGTPEVETIFFDWPLTKWCNYKCSYCSEDVTNDFTKEAHTKMYKFTLARLKTVETPFNVCITGGEPTLHPNIVEIVSELALIPNCQNISLFTNFSRPIKFYQKMQGIEKLVILASYHPEYSKQQFYENCLEMNKLSNIKFSVHVSLYDNKIHWKNMKLLMDQLKENNIIFIPCLLNPTDHYIPNYDEEFINEFKKYLDSTDKMQTGTEVFKDIRIQYTDNSVEFIKDYNMFFSKLNRFKGYKCKTVSYSINFDGTITNTCTSRKAHTVLNDSHLIVEEICPKDICPSKRLIQFYKEKM